MKDHSIHYASNSQEWETPKKLFDELNQEFKFLVDACSSTKNTKCLVRYDDCLTTHWLINNHFMNPPYGRDIIKFIKKAYQESLYCLVVCLVPARTDTKWWSVFWDRENHKPKPGVQVRFLEGRLKFELDGKSIVSNKGQAMSAPFPSAIVIMNRN